MVSRGHGVGVPTEHLPIITSSLILIIANMCSDTTYQIPASFFVCFMDEEIGEVEPTDSKR